MSEYREITEYFISRGSSVQIPQGRIDKGDLPYPGGVTEESKELRLPQMVKRLRPKMGFQYSVPWGGVIG